MADDTDRPVLYVLVGPNGSGKSTVTELMGISEKVGDQVVNPDLYAEGLTWIDDPVERSRVAAVDTEVIRNSLLNNRMTFAFETVGTRPEKLEFLRRAKDAGYFVEVVFVTTSDPEINKARVRQRVSMGGHDVDDEAIVRRYEKSMALMTSYIDIADRARVIDNSAKATLVFSKNGDRMKILENPDAIPWVRFILADHYEGCSRTLPNP